MNKHIFGCALSIFLLSFSLSANAEYKANTFGADKRIQYFKYTPDDVFVIKTKIGRSTLIQFEEGETITDDGGLGMGEAKAWSLAVKGSNIFFKPVRQLPDTNMVVVTNKRTYAFELKLNTVDNDITYVARFDYPSQNKPLPPEVAKSKKVYLRSIENKDGGETIYIDSRINVHYYRMGDAIIAPTNAWDDNLFTYLKYDNAKDLPTVYRVLPDGSETLVNSHTKDNLLVIHEVADKLRLRLGSLVVDLHNANKQQSTFNYQATSEDNLIRLVK